MRARTSLALRALRGARWAPAAAFGAGTAPVALATGGGLAVAVPVAATVTLGLALAGTGRRQEGTGLAGIARAWARAHPWHFGLIPAAGLTAALLALDAITGWPSGTAPLAGLAVLTAPRLGALRRSRTPAVRAAVPLPRRHLTAALPAAPDASPGRVEAGVSAPSGPEMGRVVVMSRT